MSTIERAAEKLARKRQAAAADQSAMPSPGNDAAPEAQERVAVAPAPVAPATPAAAPLGSPYEPPKSTFTATPVRHSERPKETVTFRFPAVPSEAAEVDIDALQKEGFLPPSAGRSAQSQEFRKIKRQLLNKVDRAVQEQRTIGSPTGSLAAASQWKDGAASIARRVPPNLVMVTSALAGEGKTFVSSNLALSLSAEVDRAVLLIDGDIAKADATKTFGITGRPGLGEVLKNPAAVNDAYLSTNIPRLSMIGAGQYHDNLDELFASELMEAFVLAVAEQNPDRIVLFDAPPLLVTTEAAVLARHMSQIVLVVESNRTPKEAVAQALAEVHDCDNISLVLNKTSGQGRFGYGYGYGYAYSSQDTTQEIEAVNTGTHS